jgi:NADPH2:quinone reductase
VSIPDTMTAWALDRFGGPEVFDKRELPVPPLPPDEVLVRVRATSVNPVDYKIRRGDAEGLCPERPAVLHGDVAGTVVAVGDEGDAFAPGDAVYGCAGGYPNAPHGALADYMPCDPRLLAPKPETLSFRAAATLPLVGLTVWEALVDKAAVGAEDHVLVHGATGGVGHIGLQLAAAHGCTVTTTASSRSKLEQGAALGADHLVHYEEESVADYVARCTDTAGFDVVFDTVGFDTFHRSVEAARWNGAVATVNPQVDLDLRPAYNKGLTLHLVLMLIPMLQGVGRAHQGVILRRLAEWVDDDVVRPLVDDRAFTFDDIGAAHAHAEAGEQVGKVAVEHPDA